MRMDVNRVAATSNQKVKDAVQKIDAEFGKHDFIVCWSCTAKSLGIKTLEESAESKTGNEDEKITSEELPKVTLGA